MFAHVLLDAELAARHAPVLLFDRDEPFLPSRVGYAVHRAPADSLVDYRRTAGGPAPLLTVLPGFAAVVEYGIWWDWDIQHLYELEAAWVYLDGAGTVLRVEASWHGRFHEMLSGVGPSLRGGRTLLYSQPGKHAFAPNPEWFTPRERYVEPCRDRAGTMGVHVTPLFEGRIKKTAADDERVRRYLEARSFTPSFIFDQEFPITEAHLCPWPELRVWIPERVAEICAMLRAEEREAGDG